MEGDWLSERVFVISTAIRLHFYGFKSDSHSSLNDQCFLTFLVMKIESHSSR